ncbi:MAG: prolyl oligopeptidase family serine peptidase [Anaerolineales bacterium]|nr:prolyl oligopeptidase family serine peptidase [Anaerolineales bacterium]MCB9144123.1 prolyl oligopeptidase family serine peptidase [Anaerolineales bacterium]
MLTLPELLRLPNVDNGLPFAISPDEKRIVFSWNKSGTWELWEVRDTEIRKLEISLPGAKFSPHFSPDGTKIAFALDLDGSESYHIAVHDFTTGTSTDLTPDILYAHQPNMAWSPDGETLAVLSEAKGSFALYLQPVDGSPAPMIKNVFRPSWDVTWAPDGMWVALESESTASDRTLHLVPMGRRKGPRVSMFQLMWDGKPLNAQHPVWSPDSKFLAFSAEVDEWHDIGLLDLETREITWVDKSAGDKTQPTWSRSGDVLGWVQAEGVKTSFKFKKRGAELHQIKVGDGLHSFPQFVSDGVILLYEDANHPTDLWKINLESGKATQLTRSLDEDLNFVEPEEVWYESRDGVKVPAMLYRGNGKQAVINIHGGPNWHFSNIWHPLMSYMAAQGWTVLGPNYRGSTGYGKKWQNASRYDMGGIDTDDCAAGVKYLIENGLAEKDKVAVTGRSHGGFLTMCCMTFHPHLFAGGSAVVPFLDWLKSHKNSREDLQHWNVENMGDPEDNREIWISHSPYFFLDRVNAPVQMICGANDPRCPASESVDAHEKLQKLGKQSELLLYEDEGHVFLKIENVIEAEMKRVEFLKRVLKD